MIEHVATFAATVWAAQVPMITPLSLKVIVPVGVPAPGGGAVMVAVNVTGCPKIEGFRLEDTVMIGVAFAMVTVCV